MDTPFTASCCLEARAVPSPETESDASEVQVISSVASASRTSALPGMFGNSEYAGSTETCVLGSVFGPHLRWNTTALVFPVGDGVTTTGVLLQISPQPETPTPIRRATSK